MKGFLCLKKTFFTCFLALLLSVCCSLFATCESSQALSVVGVGSRTLGQSTSFISYTSDGVDNTLKWNNGDNASYFFPIIQYNNSLKFSRIHYVLNQSIPANSLLNFNLSFDYYVNNGVGIPYFQPSSFNTYHSQRVVTAYSCDDNNYEAGGSTVYNFSCSFSVYFSSDSSTFDIYFDLSSFSGVSQVKPSLSRVSFVTFDYDALSDNDKDWLTDDFAEVIAGAVAEGQKDADEEQKQQAETQASDSETEANTQGGDSSTQGQTLLQAFSGFVSAITNVQPANSCEFDLDFSGYNPNFTTTVDLCEFPLPSGLTFIGSIFLILFCVPLSISTVRKMIGLFRSFQT